MQFDFWSGGLRLLLPLLKRIRIPFRLELKAHKGLGENK